MGIARLNPSYKIAPVGWVERSNTHHHDPCRVAE